MKTYYDQIFLLIIIKELLHLQNILLVVKVIFFRGDINKIIMMVMMMTTMTKLNLFSSSILICQKINYTMKLIL